MRPQFKARFIVTAILLSLGVAQGFVVHASQTILKSVAKKQNMPQLVSYDFLQHYP